LPETLELTDEDDASGGRFGLHRAGLAPGLVLLGAASGYTAITGFAPLYAREIGLTTSGGLYATFSLTILGFRLLTRKLADRHARLNIALPGLALNTLGLMALALFRHPVAAYLSVAVFGIGFALLFPALMAFTADRAPDSQRGSAMTTFTMFFDFGAVIGTYVVGVLAENLGFDAGFGLPAAMCALATAGVAARVLFGFGRQAKTR
jgi:MFS family permease